MKHFHWILAFCILFSFACKNPAHEPAQSFHWLQGNWEAKDQGFTIQEEWKLEGDTMLAGYDKAFTGDGSVIMEEKMGICRREQELYYLLTLNRVLVAFKLNTKTDHKPGEYIFENPNPGFPERVIIKKINESNFIAAIEGGKGESHVRREMSFNKTK